MGGVVCGVLYDKTIEIQKSKKDYLKPIWKQAGWNSEDSIYRLEFRFKIEFLKQLGFQDYAEVMQHLGALWAYASKEWLRLSIPNPEDSTKSRWPTHPLWNALSVIDWGMQESAPLSRVITPGSAPTDQKLFRLYAAALTSYMATQGKTDPMDAAIDLFEKTRDSQDELQTFTGRSFDEFAQDRAARKAMQWNLRYPGIDERLEAARTAKAAADYRKQSGR